MENLISVLFSFPFAENILHHPFNQYWKKINIVTVTVVSHRA